MEGYNVYPPQQVHYHVAEGEVTYPPPQQAYPHVQQHGNYPQGPNYPPQQEYYPQGQNYPPQQGYPQGQRYPPQQEYPQGQNYPPQQEYPQGQNYPPQQEFYPQGQSYPPQQGYYPQGQSYPLQQEVPPLPYYTTPGQQHPFPPSAQVPPSAQQQPSTEVVVITSQPTPVAQTVAHTPTKDHYLTLSIILVFVCFFCLKCEALFCVVPAILFAIGARDAELRGDMKDAKSSGQTALILDIVAIVYGVSYWVITGIVWAAVSA